METKDLITLGLAGYGAALSTYNLAQAVRRDRRQLKVTMNTAMYTYASELGPAMVSIEVVNIGHRPIIVSAPTLRLPNRKSLVLIGSDGFNEFPKQLSDGASGVVRIRYRDVAEALRNAGYSGKTEITPICSDTSGGTFHGKSWRVNIPEWLGM